MIVGCRGPAGFQSAASGSTLIVLNDHVGIGLVVGIELGVVEQLEISGYSR